MKRIKLLIPIFALLVLNSCSYIDLLLPVKSPNDWSRTYGGSSNEMITDMKVLNKGFIFGGYTASYTNDVISGNKGEYDYWLIKTDEAGRVLWEESYGGRASDYLYSVAVLSDGNYVMAGTSNSVDRDVKANHGAYDAWILKVSSLGFVKWKKCFGGSEDDYIYRVIENQVGDLIFAGYTKSKDGDIQSFHNDSIDAWVFSTDADGNMLWENTFGGSLHDGFSQILMDGQGGYWLGGTTGSNDGEIHSGNHGGNDVWLVHIDKDGTLLSEKTFGGSGNESFYDMKFNSKGNIMLACTSASLDGDIKSGNQGAADYWLAEISLDGAIVWEKSYGGSGEDILRDIEILPAGYQLGGYTYSLNGDVTAPRMGQADAWVLRVDSVGNMLTQYTFGGAGEDRAYSVKALTGNRIILSGTTTSTDAEITAELYGGYDNWVLMKDSIE